MRRILKVVLGTALALALLPGASAAAAPATHDVLVVGNNWEGTADVVDPRTFERLIRLDIIPDREERVAEIMADPPAAGYFTGINLLIGEGNHQYVDDAFTSHDGRFLFVSRPSFKDVVAFDLATKQIVWRFQVDGYRADHMAISPDGRTVLVSASTGNVVHAIDTASGKETGRFESGDSPHENNYTADGKLIYHASIGLVYTPADDPEADGSKGDRYFDVVDASTLAILKRIDMGEKLEEAGYPNMSAAVRPMAIAPGEKQIYLQVSFFHGFVEYDLEQDRVLRLANLPISEEASKLRRDEYVLDSAHHGIAMNPEGTKLCVAGTMSDYAAIVSRATFATNIAATGGKPYWSTNSGDGRYCFISFSGDDRVSVVSYAKEKEIASIPVGDHPQRMRMGTIRCGYLGPAVDCQAPRISRLRVVRTPRGRRLQFRLSEPALLRVTSGRVAPTRPPSHRVRRRGRAGVNRLRVGELRFGDPVRVEIDATDAAANRSRPKRIRVRPGSPSRA